MSPLFLIFIISMLWCFALIIIGIRLTYFDDDVKITPFHIVILSFAILASFVPFFNTVLALLFTCVTFSILDDEGYFDKFKAWWHTPIFKDKG